MQNKFYLSSTGSGAYSLTLKGIAVYLVPLIIQVFQYYGYEIAEAPLFELIEAIGTGISAGMVIYGGIRRIINSIKKN